MAVGRGLKRRAVWLCENPAAQSLRTTTKARRGHHDQHPLLKPLTPLAAHQHRASSVSRSVVTFPTPQEVVPEYCCALEKETAYQTAFLEMGLENLTLSTPKPLSFPCTGGQGSGTPMREKSSPESTYPSWGGGCGGGSLQTHLPLRDLPPYPFSPDGS